MATSAARIVLACLIAKPEWHPVAVQALAELGNMCFSGDAFDAAIWTALGDFAKREATYTPVDVLALAVAAGGADDLATVRGLLDLVVAETRETFDRRLEVLRKETFHRVAVGGLQRVVAKVVETGVDCDVLAALERAQTQLGRKARTVAHYRPLTADRVKDTLSDARRKRTLPTGFASIDAASGGYLIGGVVLIAARTNVGKSSFLAALARNQIFPNASDNIDHQTELLPATNEPTDRRLVHGWPQQDKQPVAPHVLVLSVEDDVDDYIGRFTCDLVGVLGRDYLDDPGHAIYADGRGPAFEKMAAVIGTGGRLTIADYEDHEGQEEKTIEAIEATILGWARTVRAQAAAAGEKEPPLLVLVDYFQIISSPEDEAARMQERQILARVSARLIKLARKRKLALAMATMLLRGPDEVEPDHNDVRGGSDVTQDAHAVWTIWPFGSRERRAIQVAVPKPSEAEAQVDQPVEGEDDNDFIDPPGFLTGPDMIKLDQAMANRACAELLISGDKSRYGAAGWCVPLYFDRPYKRITEAYDCGTKQDARRRADGKVQHKQLLYRKHKAIAAALAAERKAAAKPKN